MQVSNQTIAIIMSVLGVFLLLRIITQWRRFSMRRQPVDWDEHFIQGLRKAGVDTFLEQSVDFFFTLPTRESSEQLAGELRMEGYDVDILEAREISGQYSVHASRRMRLIVPDMQQLTVRFNAMAARHGGQYDNWAVVTKQG